MNFTLIFLVFLFVPHGQAVEIQVISKLVNDLIKNEKVPTILSVFSCWHQMDKFHFLKSSKIRTAMSSHFEMAPLRKDDNTNKMCYFIDMRCSGSHEFLNRIDPSYFGHPFRWMLFEPNEDRLMNLTFLVDSNILLINFNEALSRYDLKQVYKIDKEQSNFIPEFFGYWSNDADGLTDLRESRILSRRRRDLRGKVLKSIMVISQNETLQKLDDIKDSEVDFPAKAGYQITNLLAQSVNASVSYEYANTWGYGDMKYPEKLKGMMGGLARNEIDVGGTVMSITEDRIPHVEFLAVTLTISFAFIFRAPPLSYVSNIYYLPFNTVVWICSILLVVVCTTLIYIVYKFSKDEDNSNLTTSDFVLYGISTVCQMGSQVIPRTLAGKIATFVFCMSAVFIFTSYTASIVALLQSTSKSIQTLSDLLNSDMDLGVEDTPYSLHFFSSQTEPIRKRIYETKVAPPNEQPHFVNATYGISMVRKGFYAFHMIQEIAYKHVKQTFYEHEKCGLIQITYLQNALPMHAIPKNSPYKELFKISLFKLQENGIQSVVLGRRLTSKPTCDSNTPIFESVRIVDCYFIVLVFCWGIFGALIFIWAEFKFKKCNIAF